MRLFFALPIDKKLALDIAVWRDRMLMASTSWVPVANYHITLSFLGDVAPGKLESLCARCSQEIEASGIHSGQLSIDQTGFWSKPGILWIGPTSWSESLSDLNKLAAKLGHSIGAKKDKRSYRPHITISRKCSLTTKPLVEPDFTMQYDHVCLYESRQTRAGVQYEELASWPLTAPRPAQQKLPTRPIRSAR